MEPYRDSQQEVYSRKVRAGKRTYIFDVRATRGNDYYLTITERKRLPDGYSYQKQKIFLYKEDFIKFVNSLQDVMDYVRTELLPDYDFEQHRDDGDDNGNDASDLPEDPNLDPNINRER